jgi:hypothetical protein
MPFDDPACFRLDRRGPAAGYCVRTLKRAKRRLGVVARRVRKDGRAFWQWSVVSQFAVWGCPIIYTSGIRGVPCFRGFPSTPSCRRGRRESM